jgi:TM2 domain-containing membrane protein YozV
MKRASEGTTKENPALKNLQVSAGSPGSQLTAAPNRRRAILWCAALGWCGAHRFYLKQPGFGALYLLFSWTLIPLIASWIDLVVLCIQDDEDFAEERREIPLLQPPAYDARPLLNRAAPVLPQKRQA